MATLPIPTPMNPTSGDFSAFDPASALPRGDPSGLPIPSPDQDLSAGTLPVREMPPATPPPPDAIGIELVRDAQRAAGIPPLEFGTPAPGDVGRFGNGQQIPAQLPGRFGTNQRA